MLEVEASIDMWQMMQLYKEELLSVPTLGDLYLMIYEYVKYDTMMQ